jgi:major vault protein
LERQRIKDEAEAEQVRKQLLELQALSAAVESTGQAKAEAQSRAESSRIEGEAAVEQGIERFSDVLCILIYYFCFE